MRWAHAAAFLAGATCGAAVFRLGTQAISSEAARGPAVLARERGPAPRQGLASLAPVLRFNTTRGSLELDVHASRCPKSARQLRSLVASGFLDQTLALWRVNKWIVQFGADKSPAARKRDGEPDPFAAVRASFGNDVHPDCAGGAPCDGGAPWRRGDLAVIGPTALLVVRRPNAQMGTSPKDCAVASVRGDGAAVLDGLEESYGNMIDHGRGLAQKEIFKTGLEGVLRDFPRTDLLLGASWATPE